MTTVIRCGRLFTATDEDVIGGVTVIVENGRIAGVERGLAGGPKGAEVIDASRHLVMPGMIDSHLHLMGRTPTTYCASASRCRAGSACCVRAGTSRPCWVRASPPSATAAACTRST